MERTAQVSRLPDDTLARLLAKVTDAAAAGCRHWTGYYQGATPRFVFRDAGTIRNVQVRTVLWEHEVGPVPDGRFVVTRCGDRACVAVDHLVAWTMSERLLAYNDPCRRGHARTPKNTHIEVGRQGSTFRRCRLCRQITTAARSAAKKEEAARAQH